MADMQRDREKGEEPAVRNDITQIKHTMHGLSKTKTYRKWQSMKWRYVTLQYRVKVGWSTYRILTTKP